MIRTGENTGEFRLPGPVSIGFEFPKPIDDPTNSRADDTFKTGFTWRFW